MIMELFKRWSEAEPDRCQPCGDISFAIACHFPSEFVLPGSIAAEDAQPCGKLLWALLMAIANRGWDYDLHSEESRHYASVEPRDRAFQDAIDNSAAITLLTAYVQALEAPVFARPPADWSDLTF